MRLPRGPAPGTLQLRVKFSPTGCQAGSGTSSTRSGRSARRRNHGCWKCHRSEGLGLELRGPRRGGCGFREVGSGGEDPLTQGAGPGRESSGVRAWPLRTHESANEPAPAVCARSGRSRPAESPARECPPAATPQPAQTPLGPIPAQRGLQATALGCGGNRAVGAAVQPQRSPRSTSATRGCRSAQKGSCVTAARRKREAAQEPPSWDLRAPLPRVRDSQGIGRGHSREFQIPAGVSGLQARSRDPNLEGVSGTW